MLALTAMSSGIQAVFFTVAVVLFIVGAVRSWAPKLKVTVDFTALGLAVFVFVFAWNAWAAS